MREADWSGIAHSDCIGVLKTVGPQYMGTVTVQDPDDADVIVCTFLNPYADNLILLSFDEVRRRYGRDAAEVACAHHLALCRWR